MNKEELYETSFHLIAHSGNARSLAMEAIYAAKDKNFDEADSKIKESEQELLKAHRFQTELIQKEASGGDYNIPILLVHAQDHLMTAITLKDLAIELIDVRKEINK